MGILDRGDGSEATDDDSEATGSRAPVIVDADATRSRPPSAAAAPDHPPSVPGDTFVDEPERYSVEGRIGAGGMGTVLAAKGSRLGRSVALKVVTANREDLRRRFEREAQVTARLQHPAIVPVYGSGRGSNGQPFYAMKQVSGDPLDKVIAKATTLDKRIALLPNVIAVTEAIAYAHAERVIHRDLKPANILVGGFGETVVIDWGLAKDLSQTDDEAQSVSPYRATSADQTAHGKVMGTPAYMPIEQARGERVDERSDVYALGAILYHVLAGVPPFVRPDEGSVPWETMLARVLSGPPAPLETVQAGVPPDLVAIVARALATDPGQRYPSAGELASDLKRFQTGQLVTSHRYTTRELLARWVRRHRGAVVVGSLALAVLAIVAVIGIWRILDEKQRADREAVTARAAQLKAEQRADLITLAQARAALETDPTAALTSLGQLASADPTVWVDARRIAADAASRGVAHVLAAGDGDVDGLAFSPDGKWLASGGDDRVVRLWDLATWTGRELGRSEAPFVAVGFTSDGASIVAVDDRGGVWRCARAGGCAVVRAGVKDAFVKKAAIAPGAVRVALFDDGVLFELASGAERKLGSYQNGGWTPDGSALLLSDRDVSSMVDRFDLASGAITHLTGDVDADAVATDGKHIALGIVETGKISELSGSKTKVLHDEHRGPVGLLAYQRGGALVSASSDREWYKGIEVMDRSFRAGDYSIIVWRGPAQLERLVGHGGNITSLAIAPRDDVVASGGADGKIRVWAIPQRRDLLDHAGAGNADRDLGPDHRVGGPVEGGGVQIADELPSLAAIAIGGRGVLVATIGPALSLVDLAAGKTTPLSCCPVAKWSVKTGPDGKKLITIASVVEIVAKTLIGDAAGKHFVLVDSNDTASAVDVEGKTGKQLVERATAVAISGDGKSIATADSTNRIRIWNLADGAPRDVASVKDVVMALAFAPDGVTLAAATRTGITVYAGGVARELAAPAGLRTLAFSPDGKLLAGGGPPELGVWSVDTGARRTFTGHRGSIVSVAFAPDGTSLASTGSDKTVRVWRLADGSSAVLRGHNGAIVSVAFRRDGRSLVTASDDRTARIWDLPSGDSRVLRGHDALVLVAGFTADDEHVISVDHDGRILVSPDDLPRGEAALRPWLAAKTNLTSLAH